MFKIRAVSATISSRFEPLQLIERRDDGDAVRGKAVVHAARAFIASRYRRIPAMARRRCSQGSSCGGRKQAQNPSPAFHILVLIQEKGVAFISRGTSDSHRSVSASSNTVTAIGNGRTPLPGEMVQPRHQQPDQSNIDHVTFGSESVVDHDFQPPVTQGNLYMSDRLSEQIQPNATKRVPTASEYASLEPPLPAASMPNPASNIPTAVSNSGSNIRPKRYVSIKQSFQSPEEKSQLSNFKKFLAQNNDFERGKKGRNVGIIDKYNSQAPEGEKISTDMAPAYATVIESYFRELSRPKKSREKARETGEKLEQKNTARLPTSIKQLTPEQVSIRNEFSKAIHSGILDESIQSLSWLSDVEKRNSIIKQYHALFPQSEIPRELYPICGLIINTRRTAIKSASKQRAKTDLWVSEHIGHPLEGPALWSEAVASATEASQLGFVDTPSMSSVHVSPASTAMGTGTMRLGVENNRERADMVNRFDAPPGSLTSLDQILPYRTNQSDFSRKHELPLSRWSAPPAKRATSSRGITNPVEGMAFAEASVLARAPHLRPENELSQVQERQGYLNALITLNNFRLLPLEEAMKMEPFRSAKMMLSLLFSEASENPESVAGIEDDCYVNSHEDLFHILQGEKEIRGLLKTSWEELPYRILQDQGKLYAYARLRQEGDSGHRYAPNGEWESRIPVPDELMPENFVNLPHSGTDENGLYYKVDRPMKGALRMSSDNNLM